MYLVVTIGFMYMQVEMRCGQGCFTFLEAIEPSSTSIALVSKRKTDQQGGRLNGETIEGRGKKYIMTWHMAIEESLAPHIKRSRIVGKSDWQTTYALLPSTHQPRANHAVL